MSFVLDTCVLSELLRPRPEPAVVGWLRSQPEDSLYSSSLTLGELEKGVVEVQDEARRRKLRNWIDHDLARRFAGRILDVDAGVASLWGKLQGRSELAGKKMPVLDGLIAATVLHHGFSVVTRNVRDLRASGVDVVNPWLGA
ncbi:MAG: type II toxin-antitoxin system VapC family toxin [Holophagales bacterium]|nr:type II toxin-antitoxin system VapC family toxin [Holophagales bacterium]